jgi:prevent-host-death family protein
MNLQKITLPAGQFKARCLQLMDEVNEQGVEITITKHGQPVAKLVPIATEPLTPARLYGAMAGMVTVVGDIEAPLDEAWEVNR